MKIELIVSGVCPFCLEAEKVWRVAAADHGFEFVVLDIAQPEGAALAQRLNLQTVPALLIGGVLRAVGVQSPEEALTLLHSPRQEAHDRMQQMGFAFSPDNRWFILTAQVYLMLAGLGLLMNSSFLSDNAARPAFMHLFTLGFMLFMIYGLASHMLPRFTGNPIREGSWPWLQMGLAHCGVIGYAAGYLAGRHTLIVVGAVLTWLSLAIFAFRVWPVLWPEEA
ncbi:MAG: thioredoxin family protein [Gammaproteobacteria bacterium]|nr:thioredoxin family protein [Gammaproteobacteria bacterium]MBU1978274.1 thioredoxin family protein [Gammaproteobacteria bacterium]